MNLALETSDARLRRKELPCYQRGGEAIVYGSSPKGIAPSPPDNNDHQCTDARNYDPHHPSNWQLVYHHCHDWRSARDGSNAVEGIDDNSPMIEEQED
jgi:hypothetical protein